MNVLIVDTSVWILYFSGEPNEHLDLALKEARIWLPPIVASELLSAPLTPAKRESLIDFLAELPLCDCAFDHWTRVGELRARCAEKGFKVSTPDAHIAQCALDMNAYLTSEDYIFGKIAKKVGLKLLHEE